MLQWVPDNILSMLRSLVRRAADAFPGCRVYLFGSYAKRTFHGESDVDVAFFIAECPGSEEMNGVFRKICSITRQYDFDIQPQVFPIEELREPMGIVEEIVESGIDISGFAMQNNWR